MDPLTTIQLSELFDTYVNLPRFLQLFKNERVQLGKRTFNIERTFKNQNGVYRAELVDIKTSSVTYLYCEDLDPYWQNCHAIKTEERDEMLFNRATQDAKLREILGPIYPPKKPTKAMKADKNIQKNERKILDKARNKRILKDLTPEQNNRLIEELEKAGASTIHKLTTLIISTTLSPGDYTEIIEDIAGIYREVADIDIRKYSLEYRDELIIVKLKRLEK